MSVRVMTAVWALALPDSEKIVLLALADCANDEGHCWPGMASLVQKCSKSDRTIQAAIKALCDAGHLTRREVPGKGCNYTVHPVKQSGCEGYMPPEFHYLYRIDEAETGEFYIGARTSLDRPASDDYMGSGKWVKARLAVGAELTKTVLGEYPSREALAFAEQAITSAFFGTELCRNEKIATPGTLTPTKQPPQRLRPGETSPRSDCGTPPKPVRDTPEAASGKPSKNHQKPSYLKGIGLPEGFPVEPYMALVKARLSLRPKVHFTEDAARGIVRKCLKLEGDGYDIEKLLWKAVDQGWRTVFPNDDCKAISLRGDLTPEQLEERARFFESVGKVDEANDYRRRATEQRLAA